MGILTPYNPKLAMRMLSCLAALFAFSLCTTTAHAQYRFDHWTADNGLPQNSVRGIVQAQDGYLWFTTFDGLVRFDGVRFTVFNKSNSPGITSNRFVQLFEDRFGDLWATMETGGVVRRHQGRFTTYTKGQGVPDTPLPLLTGDAQENVVLYSLQTSYDRQGNLLNNAIDAYTFSQGKFQPAQELSHSLSGAPISFKENGLITLTLVIEGDLWVLTEQRIIRYLKGGGTQVYDQQNGLPGILPKLILGKRLPLQAVTRDVMGRLWLTDLKTMHSQLLSMQTPEGFDGLFGCAADSEGNYWFSTGNNGLFCARRQMITPYGKAQGLDVKESYPLLESRDGAVWIGTAQGLFRLKDGAFTRSNDAKITFGLGVTSLYEDRAGQLWLNGFWRLVGESFVRAPWIVESLFATRRVVWTVCEERAGAVW